MRDKVHFRHGLVAGYDLNGDGRFKERLKGYNKKLYQRDTRIRLKKELIRGYQLDDDYNTWYVGYVQ